MAASLRAVELRHEYLINPIGTGEPRPRLSWKLAAVDPAAKGLTQTAYHIRVASTVEKLAKPDLWDSGKVMSNQTVFIEYAGRVLQSGQRAYWSVRVWDQADQASADAEPAFWEMGLLDRAEWKGQWIGSHVIGSPKVEAPVPFVRKTFSINKPIAQARLYATALGLYEFHLNGRRVGEDWFTPLYTDYRKRVQYQAYDVTAMLQQGDNAAGAILGDGWYCGTTGNLARRQFYGDRPKLLAQLIITHTDGSVSTIATDNTWQTAVGPILFSDFMNGEAYDARHELTGWSTAAYQPDGRWSAVLTFDDPGVPIVPMHGQTVRVTKTLLPVSVTKKGNASIVDFGQNLVGVVRLKRQGIAGETVRLRFAEVLDEKGNFYTANLRSARQTDHYTFKGDAHAETWTPRFTFHGFRYVEITGGASERQAHQLSSDLLAEQIEALVLHTDMRQTGEFECSEPLLNQLQHNIEWGQRGNFLDIPTDCPQRDERLGWTGDAQVFCRTAAFNFDVSGFFAKWTQDLRDAQDPQRGTYPSVVPNSDPGMPDGGPAWADAGVIVPWTMWQVYGDRRLIEQHFDSMKTFVDRQRDLCQSVGLIRLHPSIKHQRCFGDWLSQDGHDGLLGATPKDLIGTAFLAYDASLLAQMARAINKPDDAAAYQKLCDDVAAAFRRRFVSPDGLLVGHTQTAYVLALMFDLLPEDQRQAAVDALVENIRNFGNRLNTGFVGTVYLPHVLSRFNRLDVAYTLLMQKKWPSWLYAVTQGATTIWERWDGWTPEKGFQDAGMNSFNHYAYGAIGAWLYQVLVGIELQPDRPGYEQIIFEPRVQKGVPLTHARAAIETCRGKVQAAWQLADQQLHYTVTVPPNCTALVRLPATPEQEITSGTHQFTCTLR